MYFLRKLEVCYSALPQPHFRCFICNGNLLAFVIHFEPSSDQPSHMVSGIHLTLVLFSSASTPPQITQLNSLIPNTH